MDPVITVAASHIYARVAAGIESGLKIKLGSNGTTFNSFDSVVHEVAETGYLSSYMDADYTEYSGVADIKVTSSVSEVGLMRRGVLVLYADLGYVVKLRPGKHTITIRVPRDDNYNGGFVITA